MPVINITRALRVGNEAGISGAEAPTVEGVITLDQVISAGVEEAAAMSGFKDRLMQNIALVSDQDVDVQFLGLRYAILQTVAGPPGEVTFTGDLEQEIFSNDLIRLEGTVADDGVYLVDTVVENLGDTTIALQNGQDIPTGGGGAVGTLARVCSHQIIDYVYALATQTAASGLLTIAGDVSNVFADGDWLEIYSSTGNDGLWEIATVTTDGPPVTTTTITVIDRAGGNTLPDNTDTPGVVQRVNPFFELVANEPLLWSIADGQKNPFINPDVNSIAPLFNIFRGDVIHCLVNNAGATNANFQGRIGTNADIF